MRPIKFRTWDKIAKMFCQVPGAVAIDNNGVLYPVATEPETDIVIQQFTGLLDKNGKEIYEGDWVTWNTTKYKHRVEMKEGCWKVGATILGRLKEVEVIGNIYENPSLLTPQA
jgi:uncharacterized phage protein (TIGR01671 family)